MSPVIYIVTKPLPTRTARAGVPVVEPPSITQTVRGDGNCYFRAACVLLTGSQADHHSLRRRTVSYMQENQEVFSDIAHIPGYPHNSGMDKPGQWATEVEIYALASMLATPICVFSPYGPDTFKWLTYEPIRHLQPLSNLPLTTSKMYITNQYAHFDPVFDI